jgi:PilZ domain
MADSEKTSPESGAERRRRARVRGDAPGWIIRDNTQKTDPWEVRVVDVNRHGVGFESGEQLSSGDVVLIRIGRGPLEQARRVRVVRCHPGTGGTFRIGGEFV